MTWNNRLENSWWALRIGLGLAPVLAGLDKFTNLLADWPAYLSPLVTDLLPLSAPVFMRAVGIVEIVVGLAVLTRWTRLGAYVAMAWLVAIAVNLVTTGGYFDVAVRDVLLAIAAYTLAQLTGIREQAQAESGRPARPMPGRAVA